MVYLLLQIKKPNILQMQWLDDKQFNPIKH